MNVSSVKNLNGEVLSAVQDATLTDVVQSNSAQWGQGGEFPDSAYNAITSYQTNSGDYLIRTSYMPTIGRSLTGNGVFGLAVGARSKSFDYGLAIGEHTNRYVKNARSNAAIGYSAHAYGTGSQAFGEQVVVSAGMAIGKNNKTSACSFVIGNGTSNTSRNDIFVINYDGSVSAAGKISANGVELGAGGGNQEVESYVQTNSGTIDEAVTSYQNNSGKYLTSHQAISANEWNDCYNNVNTNSGAWASTLPTYEYDNTNKISAINGSALAGGGDDTFYIYPGKTTDKEISENSGKDLKLYNSANNVFLDFAGKSTLSKYTMFSFKEITGTQANQNTVQHLRLRVYPNATSACKLYDTNTVNLLDSNSTVSTAQTAYYDVDGNSLTQTHSELTALNYFVQSNSANWGGGSSPAGSSNVLFHLYSNNDPNYGGSYTSYISVAKDLYFEASVSLQESNPSDIIIIRGGSEIGRAFWSQVSSDGIYNYFTAYYNNHDGSEISLQNNGNNYQCYVSADGLKTNAFEQRSYYCKTNDTIKINVQGYNVTGNIIGLHQGNGTTLTSFTGSLSNFTAKGYDQYNTDIGSEDYNQDNSYDISAEFGGGGSTVASGDVFPPTNNLEPQTTYYLGWNANNGGLFWYHP